MDPIREKAVALAAQLNHYGDVNTLIALAHQIELYMLVGIRTGEPKVFGERPNTSAREDIERLKKQEYMR